MQLSRKAKLLNLTLILVNFLFISNIYSSQASNSNQIYKCIDKDGNTIFTDKLESHPACKQSAQEHNIKPLPSHNIINNYKNNLSPENNDLENNLENNSDDNPYISFKINYPKNNEHINRCGGVLDIVLSIDPDLYDTDYIQILINGAPYKNPTKNTIINCNHLNRGSHNITGQVLRDNKIIQTTEPISFVFTRNCKSN